MAELHHPMQPPPELIKQWVYEVYSSQNHGDTRDVRFARLAYTAGADAQLEVCVEWVQGFAECGDSLRAAMRPKPPNCRELCLKHLEVMEQDGLYLPEIFADLRRAVEALPDDN